ncbi:MAG: hypothetical protein IJS46_02305 [Kiritimatiellae bacterium]|nr:hypothetical protein [Kiritimatiellia bacterium]
MIVRTRFRRALPSPSRALVAAFALAAAIGSVLLALPASNADGAWHLGIDRLFLATSAVCVTGLDPIGVGASLSRFGLAVLCVLVQVGGIGIMTAGTFLFIVFGRSLTVTEERSVSSSLGEVSPAAVRRTLVGTFAFTFAWEALGACVLAWRLRTVFPEWSAAKAACAGAFFAEMSFCNAGFSLFPNGFAPLMGDAPVVAASIVLSLVGGIGFVVHARILSLRPWRKNRLERGRLPLQARLVLEGLAVVVALDLAVYAALEANGAWKGLGTGRTVMTALFQAFSTRSAGFSSVPVSSFGAATILFTMAMMFVGAAPGSTGGGVKTTTISVLFATVKAMFAGQETPELHFRSLPRRAVNDAIAVLAVGLAIVFATSFALFAIERPEPGGVAALVFEAVSAFSNNGLEIEGTTAGLSTASKVVVVLAMFAGRLGPMALVLTLFKPGSFDKTKRFPEENVMIG